jgi:MFS family permease
MDIQEKTRGLKAIPRGIWALGLVSLFMDTSSELIHSLLPAFLTVTLGASVFSVGLIEGVAEATAAITKVFSGTLSDYLGKRKFLTLIGYGLGALTKPFFPLASSVGLVFAARFADRVGKGIRGAPRDALVGDLAPPHLRGASYGLRQSLDTVGAIAGPLLAMIFMVLLSGNIRAVFWVATLPAAICILILIFGVKEPETDKGSEPVRIPLLWADVKKMGWPFWGLVGITSILMLGRMSEAFFLLKAQNAGVSLAMIPVVLIGFNIVYALTAYPAGALSDIMKRSEVLALGVLLFVLAEVTLALAKSPFGVGAGVMLWGLHMGFCGSLLSAMVADAAPPKLRGTAFGILNLVTGVALLAASALAGFLWDRYGPEIAFLTSAAFATLALAAILFLPSVENPVSHDKHQARHHRPE